MAERTPSGAADPGPTHPPTETDLIGPIATPRRVALCAVPFVLILCTPLLPFAKTPTLWFGVPAVLVWMAGMVLLTVATLQVIDRGINRQAAQARSRQEARS